LATEAISGGKVHLNGQRSKAGKEVKIGNRISISKGPYRWELTVRALSKQRKSAGEAALLYEESAESLALRQARIEQRKAETLLSNPPETRPDKKQRRQIHRFKRESDS
ncbi:MAG: RNA-binding S4 domain-containing protein, partial [Methylococcales bacterium]